MEVPQGFLMGDQGSRPIVGDIGVQVLGHSFCFNKKDFDPVYIIALLWNIIF